MLTGLRRKEFLISVIITTLVFLVLVYGWGFIEEIWVGVAEHLSDVFGPKFWGVLWDVFLNFLFNPLLIPVFFYTLLIPIIPIVLLGVWLGHKRIYSSYFSRGWVTPFSNFFACGVPLLFIASCAISSWYLMFASGNTRASFLSRIDPASYSTDKLNQLASYFEYETFRQFFHFKSSALIKLWDLTVDWGFIFDRLSIAILFVVSFITSMVMVFAWVYIAGDERRPVFFLLLTVFAGFMIFLVAAQNFLILFIGWEGVGLSSFLLINFWYKRLQANKAAAKAVLVNRVGDIFLIMAIGLMYVSTHSLDFEQAIATLLFAAKVGGQQSLLELTCLFLFLAAVGKSAQIGLHTWLPDAIEGPTPVSALLHAATIVTAGVYLIIRSSPIFEHATLVSGLIAIIGLLTAFIAATIALIQYDIKKVVAYSTCSQLGYIIFSAGLGQYNISFFHLFNHAFFKALLFIAAGSIIHNLAGEQDIRRIGGLGQLSFYILTCNSIGVIALAGSFFIGGFYSKDLILETSASSFTVSGLLVYWLAVLTAVFTGIYSSDSLDDVFIEETNARRINLEAYHSVSYFEMFVLGVLALFSILSGYLFRDIFVGLGGSLLSWHSWFGQSTSLVTGVAYGHSNYILAAEFLPVTIKLLPLVISLVISFQVGRYETTVYRIYHLITFLSYKWYFDILQNTTLLFSSLKFGYSIFWFWDKFIFEQMRLLRVYASK